jgi:hypothetical protein
VTELKTTLREAARILGPEQVHKTAQWLQAPRTAAALRRQITNANNRITAMGEPSLLNQERPA